MMPLSGDPPRSRVLAVALVLIVLGLALAPFLFPGAKPLNVAAKVCIFIALATNYAGFLVPKLALITDILLMVAVLLWRPRGLYPVTSR